ncbi:MAG: multicopper oxidase domain-containing protein [Candidatus Rokuibacteriota bacterium]
MVRRSTLFRVGGQGGLLDAARVEGGVQGTLDTLYQPGEILLSTGAREDVVFIMPAGKDGDIVTLWTLDYPRFGNVAVLGTFVGLPTVPVAHFRIAGTKNRPFDIAAGTPLLLNPAVNTPIESLKGLLVQTLINPPDRFRPSPGGGLHPTGSGTIAPPPDGPDLPTTGLAGETLRLTSNAQAPQAIDRVDGFILDVGLPGGDFRTIPSIASSRFAALYDLLELRISNETGERHPWHPHGFHIQPVRIVSNITGATVYAFDYNEFVDVVDIPSLHTLVYRTRLDDRPKADFVSQRGGLGRWAMHCHIFFHAGLGMITELQVLSR